MTKRSTKIAPPKFAEPVPAHGDLTTIDGLLRRVRAFAKPRKLSDGGWAPVEPAEVDELDAIVNGLIALKYETDPDGALPIEATLIDRTRYERPYVIPIRYAHKSVDGHSEMELHIEAARSHSSLGKVAGELAARHMDAAATMLRDTSEGRQPFTLGGARYIAQAPAGISTVQVARELQTAVRHAGKAGYPEGLIARQVWSAAVAAAVSATTSVVIHARSCSPAPKGVAVSFDVPQFDANIRFKSTDRVGSATIKVIGS